MRFFLLFCISILALYSSAETFESNGLFYSINEDGKTVSVVERTDSERYSGDIIIPDTICLLDKKYAVSEIGNFAFSYCYDIVSISIPKSVKKIGICSFASCKMERVELPDSLLEIGERCFYDCNKLSEIYLGKSLKNIGGEAFLDCAALKNVFIPNSIKSIGCWAFYNCTNLQNVVVDNMNFWYDVNFGDYYSNPMSCAQHFYVNNELVDEILVPDSITEIKRYVFSNFADVKNVKFGKNLRSIGEEAFRGCVGLTSLDIPDSVESIDTRAFLDCKNVESLFIGCSLARIGDGVFNGCSNICSIVVDKNNSLFDSRDNCNAIIDTKTDELILGCYTTTIPSSVKHIGKYSFAYQDKVTSIKLPEGLLTIKSYAYDNCPGITELVIPDNVTNIGTHAFFGCTNLEYISIGKSVRTIGDAVFYDCNSIRTVSVKDLSAWCSIEFESESSNPIKFPGYFYIGNEIVRNLVIPKSINYIKNYAFCNCDALETVSFGENVDSIGSDAFRSCDAIKYVSLSGVKYIGEYVFAHCLSLEEVELGNGLKLLGRGTFSGCNNLKKVNLGEALQEVGDYAFHGCSKIESLVFPEDMEYLDSYVFVDCINLSDVKFGSKLKMIGTACFENSRTLANIYLDALTPPQCGYDAFRNVDKNYCKLNVPQEAVDLYKSAYGWSDFFNISSVIKLNEEKEAEFAINGNFIKTNGMHTRVYSIDGVLIYCGSDENVYLPNGFYILNIGNKSHKVKIR